MDKYVLRDNMKLLVKYFMRFFLKVFWIFPIKQKRIMFMANMGKGFLCNPKYLYNSMISDSRFNDYEFIWCFRNPQSINVDEFTTNTRIINKNNFFHFFYCLLTSQYIIYNCGGFSYAPIRKKQMLIETWHGGGAFKKVGFAVSGKSDASKRGIALAMKDVKLFLSSCELGTNEFIRKAMCYKGPVLNSGLPRNDILFCDDKNKREAIKKELSLQYDERIILYAPTFKGDEGNAEALTKGFELINPTLVKNAFSKKYGGVWKFYTRGHQYTRQIELPGSDGDLSDYPDMQELLMISDILITDYSSSIWDYAITKRPCYLYVPDLERYETKERGFLVPFDKWPGIKVKSNSDFEQMVNNFDLLEYKKQLATYIKMCNGYENGNACDQVKERILSWEK